MLIPFHRRLTPLQQQEPFANFSSFINGWKTPGEHLGGFTTLTASANVIFSYLVRFELTAVSHYSETITTGPVLTLQTDQTVNKDETCSNLMF